MNKLVLERCKKDKEEYDKKIRSLDYKIVETSVGLHNSKTYNPALYEEDNENSKTNQSKLMIQQYETEKQNLTKEFWDKLVAIKSELSVIINKRIKENPTKKSDYVMAMFTINKITDVYFEPDDLISLAYLFEEGESNQQQETIEQELPTIPIVIEEKKEEEQVNNPILEKQESVLVPVNEEKHIAIPFTSLIETKEETEIREEEKQENNVASEQKLEPISQESNVPKPAVVTVEKPFEVEEVFKVLAQPVQQFNIEEQRIVDFENLLNHINKISKDFRTNIEKALSRFIINYQIVKNTQYLQNDFDNIENNSLEAFKNIIQKFKKDENIEVLQERIKNQENTTKNIEQQLLTNNIEIKEMQRQMQELAKVYFVGGYVRKIQEQVAKVQGEQETENTNEKDSTNKIFVPSKDNVDNSENDVFKKIKKLTYDKRMDHIIEVSRWTKNVEEKLRVFHLEETDFQFVIYLIRQTENICNSNFEQVANIIINLCDTNLQLELAEENGINKNKKLQEEANTAQILKDGIENIRKKYSKMPFIGRKVSSILNAKMLSE